MKKFLRLFALCTTFMVSAFTQPALANTNNEAKIQTIENNTEKVIQGAVITITKPKRDWDAPTCTTNEYGVCILKRPSGEINDRFEYIITHKNYKDKEGQTQYKNNQVVQIKMTPKGITVTGTITDQAANNVEGVIVHLEDKSKGKSKKATSDEDGKYKIEELAPGSKLIFEHITYNTTEFTVPPNTPNPSDIEHNITLTESSNDIASVEVSNETCSGNGIAKGFKHENNICYPYECDTDYTLMSQDNKKVEIDQTDQAFRSKLSKLNTTCKKTQDCTTGEGIESSAYVLNNNTYICKVTCKEKQYKANNTETKCIPETQCHDTDLPLHATEGVYIDEGNDRRCKATKCEKGYTPNKDGSECVGMMVLPEDKSASRIGELETLYNTAHDNETSITNKILGTASMAATGAGGMMLASGLTEQKADQEAEEKMRGYVATFKCNYGNTNVEYGTQPTELPTSTELYNLYAEYVTLANDLKLRKDVLGMRAGIESEPILNSATSGLYDDVSSGRSAGMYTSLARAILDPNGADAAAWAEQTKKSKNLIIAGATTAGVGVIGSIVGNQLINKDAPTLASVRQEIANINSKYLKLKQSWDALQKKIDDQPTTKTCTGIEGVSGGTYPDCICKNPNYIFSPDTLCSTCGLTGDTAKEDCKCAENAKPIDLNCKCDNDYIYNKVTHTYLPKSDDTVKQEPEPEPKPECLLTGLVDTDKCECIEHATSIENVCKCTDPYHEENEACIKNEQNAEVHLTPQLDLYTDNLFDSGKSNIKDNTDIINAAAEFEKYLDANYNTIAQNYCVQTTGHTDRTKFKPNSKMNNQILSESRAMAVAKEFKKALSNHDRKYNICYQGKAATECTTDTYKEDNDERCRKVTLQYFESACPDDCQLI